MKILVRLPNWLGDMVMSVAFMQELEDAFPDAEISVIVKDGLQSLLPYFPKITNHFIFSKKEYKGLKGAYRFGKIIAAKERFDVFFCLPDSLSAALMGFAAGAKKRIGYKKELRNILLTKSFSKRKNLHRVEEYVDLLCLFLNKKTTPVSVRLTAAGTVSRQVIVNINSEASSRRLPPEKAISLINTLRAQIKNEIVLTGSPAEKEFVDNVYNKLADKKGITNLAGKTNLHDLANVISQAKLLLSTDSGIAHLGNAFGLHTIVLFGAGNENKTAPYNKHKCTVIRLGELSCEPCENNICKRFGIPKCLTLLSEQTITDEVLKHTE